MTVSQAYVGVWCIGEYGDLLVSDEGAQKASIDGQSFQAPSETDVLKLLHKLSRNISTDVVTKEYILSALVKLSDRFTSSRDTIAKMLSKFKHSSQLELQQRYLPATDMNRDHVNICPIHATFLERRDIG